MLDFIIVGQGIAGSMLSYFLLKQKKKVLVLDEYNTSSSSNISSGIINPITGRRFVKTWMADELIPFAQKTYSGLEELLQIKFFKPVSIYKLFSGNEAINDWCARCSSSEYANYLRNDSIVKLENTNNPFGAFEINGGFTIDATVFLPAFRNFLKKSESLLEEKVSLADIKIAKDKVSYKSYTAEKIIFCEGATSLKNPFFNWLPFNPTKGECLIVNIENFYCPGIINGDVFIMPTVRKGVFYVGATNHFKFENSVPSYDGKNELVKGLEKILPLPFQVMAHHAAIRPSVFDRRPIIGSHQQHRNLYIFNGMGTKGFSLAPYFAHHFSTHLCADNMLLKEADVTRFII